jgi:sugar phosphate isomerase/epimerase
LIGISAPPLAVHPFEEAVDWVVPNFDLWEMISEADHFLPDVQTKVKELIETTGLRVTVHAPFSDINIAAFDPSGRRHSVDVLLEHFRIASDLDLRTVTFHPGVVGPIQYWDRPRVDRMTRLSLEEISAVADEFSTSIALENMPGMPFATVQTAEEMEAMLDGLDIDMCFDIGHANTTDQLPWMCRLLPRFANVHVHDNMGERDEHLELGVGTVDFRDVLGRLASYNGNHIIEVKSLDMESALRSKAFLEALLE